MSACIEVKLDFSIFILQFNFFNGFASSQRYSVAKTYILPIFHNLITPLFESHTYVNERRRITGLVVTSLGVYENAGIND